MQRSYHKMFRLNLPPRLEIAAIYHKMFGVNIPMYLEIAALSLFWGIALYVTLRVEDNLERRSKNR